MVRNDILKFRTDPRPWTPRAKICLAQPATRSYRGWAAYAELLAGRAAHNSKVGQHMTSAKGLDISEPADSFEIATRRMSVIRPVRLAWWHNSKLSRRTGSVCTDVHQHLVMSPLEIRRQELQRLTEEPVEMVLLIHRHSVPYWRRQRWLSICSLFAFQPLDATVRLREFYDLQSPWKLQIMPI